MEQPRRGSFAAGPSKIGCGATIILSMQKTSPIRRYVLLRQLDHGVPAPRWSMERIGASQRSSLSAPSSRTADAHASRSTAG